MYNTFKINRKKDLLYSIYSKAKGIFPLMVIEKGNTINKTYQFPAPKNFVIVVLLLKTAFKFFFL